MSNDVTNPIFMLDYDKIVDTLMYFSPELSLKFNVRLAVKDRNDNRRFYHSEVFHPSSTYASSADVGTIKRDITYYFSIDNRDDFQNGVIMNIHDIVLLKMTIEKNILPWFFTDEVYGKSPDDGSIIINGNWNDVTHYFVGGKYISFAPIVYTYQDGTATYGVRMTINKPDTFADIDLNKFLTFYYLITNTDTYTLASTMLTYVKSEPYGVNAYNINGGPSREREKNYFDNI